LSYYRTFVSVNNIYFEHEEKKENDTCRHRLTRGAHFLVEYNNIGTYNTKWILYDVPIM